MDGISAVITQDERNTWASFIADRGHRVIGSGGSAVRWEPTAIGDSLERSLTALRDKTTDYRLLAGLYHIMQPETQSFLLGEPLKSLMRSIAAVRVSKILTGRNLSGGQVAWPETFVRRRTGYLDPGQYVWREASRSFDTPQNQLLKFYLHSVSSLVDWLRMTLGSDSLPREVRLVGQKTMQALREPYLRDVQLPARPTARMRQLALRHRNPAYRTTEHLTLELYSSTRLGRWAALFALVSRGWLQPVSDDDLFELYSLILVLDILEVDLDFSFRNDPETGISIIRRGRRSIARLRREDIDVEIYFDQSPKTAIGSDSEYYEILTGYDGLPDGKTPRPDIIMIIRRATRTTAVFIEVKDSDDDAYMRGSVYKALAYSKDFESLWDEQEKGPKVILLFPGIVTPRDTSFDQRDVVISGALDRDRIRSLVEGVIDRTS